MDVEIGTEKNFFKFEKRSLSKKKSTSRQTKIESISGFLQSYRLKGYSLFFILGKQHFSTTLRINS